MFYLRFIPVHTGNTDVKPVTRVPTTVYPRAYGEHCTNIVEKLPIPGLSPCIRGTQDKAKIELPKDRFIPVHTGNTPAAARTFKNKPVYPRAYGEHISIIEIIKRQHGLSPCIRGTRRNF